jgi:D-inositol-3-phosphate glycosyltransferase
MTIDTSSFAKKSTARQAEVQRPEVTNSASGIEVGLLTGCQDRPYAYGLALSLISVGVCVDVIGSDEVDCPELHTTRNLRFLNFRGSRRNNANILEKLSKLLIYYARLIRYAARSKPEILHILWNNNFEFFDRTILMLYYKAQRKTIALTAHNVNQAKRDSKDSFLNRLTLKIQYRLCDRIFVHTQKMKSELLEDFHVPENAVTVIPFGINNAAPCTDLDSSGAKRRLGIKDGERAILLFGRIRPYKGIENMLKAFELLPSNDQANYRLIIAGEPKKGSEEYLRQIQQMVEKESELGRIILRFQFVPDEDTELYLKAADVMVLPYKEIFQSGVLFLAYSFGLPVIATDVGSFREEIVEGSTGFLCKPGDPADLAKTIETYFTCDLYRNLKVHRQEIKDHAHANHSWDVVADLTRNVYASLLEKASS